MHKGLFSRFADRLKIARILRGRDLTSFYIGRDAQHWKYIVCGSELLLNTAKK